MVCPLGNQGRRTLRAIACARSWLFVRVGAMHKKHGQSVPSFALAEQQSKLADRKGKQFTCGFTQVLRMFGLDSIVKIAKHSCQERPAIFSL